MSKSENKMSDNSDYMENADLLKRHIVFSLTHEMVAIPLEFVKEVLDLKKIRTIPHLDYHIAGICELRREVLPIMDFKYCIFEDAQRSILNDESVKKVIVIQSAQEMFGILVDEIHDIIELQDEDFENIPSAVESSIPMEYLNDIARYEDRLIKIINLRKIISDHFNIDLQKQEVEAGPARKAKKKRKKRSTKRREKIEQGVIALDNEQKGALREICNIASGNAVVALSNLFEKKVKIDMSINELIIRDLKDFKAGDFAKDDKILIVKALMKNDLDATIFLMFPIDKFTILLKQLQDVGKLPKNVKSMKDFNKNTKSAINEVGNIIISHYCSGISDFLRIKVLHEVPEVQITEYSKFSKKELKGNEDFSEQAIILQTHMNIQKKSIEGQIVFIPHQSTLPNFIEWMDVDKIVQMLQGDLSREDLEKIEEEIFSRVTAQEDFKLEDSDKKALKINDSDLDAFRELGNIGAGNAGNALSQMLNKKVFLEIPPAKVLNIDELITNYGKKTLAVGYIGSTKGLLEANIVLSFKVRHIELLLQMIMESKSKKKLRKESDLSANEKSAVVELLNILMGHYIAALGDFMQIKIDPPEYQFFFQNTKSLFKQIEIESNDAEIKAIVIETGLKVSDREQITGEFILLLNSAVVQKVLKRLSKVW